MIRVAEERLNASIMISSSIRFLVYRTACRLNDEHIFAANIFENLAVKLPVAEFGQVDFSQRNIQMLADFLRQRQIGIPGKNFQFSIHSLVSSVIHLTHSWRRCEMAGAGGFEPPNAGSKDLCLTA